MFLDTSFHILHIFYWNVAWNEILYSVIAIHFASHVFLPFLVRKFLVPHLIKQFDILLTKMYINFSFASRLHNWHSLEILKKKYINDKYQTGYKISFKKNILDFLYSIFVFNLFFLSVISIVSKHCDIQIAHHTMLHQVHIRTYR